MCDRDQTVDGIGYSAGIILSICLIPQIYKIYRTKHVENISYSWEILYIIGISLHLYYAVYYNLLPIYIPTIIELLLIILLLCLTMFYSRNQNKTPNDEYLVETIV